MAIVRTSRRGARSGSIIVLIALKRLRLKPWRSSISMSATLGIAAYPAIVAIPSALGGAFGPHELDEGAGIALQFACRRRLAGRDRRTDRHCCEQARPYCSLHHLGPRK